MLVMAIVPKADHAIDDRVLKEHVAQRLAIYKVPRAVMVCAVLPRNALGKVNRNELRERFLARISQDA
jgi:fatty-acyl-CoA synthase